MSPEDIKAVIENTIPRSEVEVACDGSHVHLKVISPSFEGHSAVKKQQMVYGVLQDAIASGAIHAVHMNLYTPQEWIRAQD